MVNVGTVRSRTKMPGGATRWTKTVTEFNSDNFPTVIDDLGDESSSADDRCVRTWYARNSSNWMLSKVKRVEKVGVGCSASAGPGDVLSGLRVTYDDEENDWDTFLPVRGVAVKVEEIDNWQGADPVWITTNRMTYDVNGRAIESFDALDRKTTTSFVPAVTGPVTSTTNTSPSGHATTATLVPAWGVPSASLDVANQRRIDMAYDGLGRLLKIWMPGRAKAAYPGQPSKEFFYLLRNDAPTAVTTRTLLPSGNTYKSDIALYDGLLRERQVQRQAPGGGRSISDTVYDSRGLVQWTSNPYHDPTNLAPGTVLVGPETAPPPSVVEYVYDGAGRVTNEILMSGVIEKWRTVTSYDGGRVSVSPPAGGIATTSITDARDQTVQIRQYKVSGSVGSDDPTTYTGTGYSYTDRGELASMTDAAGNKWQYVYDQRGRVTQRSDPDKGISILAYDAAGQLTTSTDARGTVLAYTYDSIGRTTSLREGSTNGNKRAEWIYDTLPYGVGSLTKSIRYDPPGSANAYVNEVTAYDSAGRPSATRVTLPASEGGLCAAGSLTPCSYNYSATYRPNGDVATSTTPAAGGLPTETLDSTYNDVGLPNGLLVPSTQMYARDTYDKLGRLSSRILGSNGKRTWLTFTYDQATSRLTNASAIPENQPEVSDFTYTYDPAGNTVKISDAPAAGTADTQCYQYDYLRRLSNAWTPTSGDCAIARSVAALGGPAPYWHGYTYDDVGNRLTETRHAPGTPSTRTYVYPAQGGIAGTKPHAVTDINITGGSAGSEEFEYDEAGNTISRPGPGGQQTLEWNGEDRLAEVSDLGGVTSYVYDADGNRLIRRDPTGATLYLPGGMEVRKPSTGQAAGTKYYSQAGMTIAIRTQTSLDWLVQDHHGTAEATVSNSTLAVSRRRTLPFGETRGATPTTWPAAMDKGFVGGAIDNTGLTHLGAREYDPKIGRFVSVDPIQDLTDPQQWHGYAYANHNPATYSDPSGLKHEEHSGGGGSANPGNAPQIDAPNTATILQSTHAHVTQSPSGRIYLNGYPVPRSGPSAHELAVIISNYCGRHPDDCDHRVQLHFCISGADCEAVDDGYAISLLRAACGDDLCGEQFRADLRSDNDVLLAATESMYNDSGLGAIGIAAGSAAGGASKGSKGRPGHHAGPGGGYRSQFAACRNPNSFVAGTKILMADGTSKAIEEIRVGELVIATNPDTGLTEAKPVTATIVSHGWKDLVQVRLAPTGDRGSATVVATDEHPFWSVAEREWVDAGDLLPGDQVLTRVGAPSTVASIRTFAATAVVYNLTVAAIHTYYVMVGNTPVLVHNDGDDDLVRVGRWMSQAEFDEMSRTGVVQRGGGGYTYVVHPANPDAYRSARPGSVYAEFDVPRSSLIPGGRPGDYKMSDADTLHSRLAVKKGGVPYQLPNAANISKGGC
jgi:RHS repeat-associated protein